MLKIRNASLNDIDQLKELLKNTIIYINCKNHSKDEIANRTPFRNIDEHWKELINGLYFIVAENDENNITGFSSISKAGYLNSMLIHKDFQNKEIACALYEEIENYAKQNNILKITSQVSITAKSFFEEKGFVVDEEQRINAKSYTYINYKMSKQLAKPLNELTDEELWQLFPIIISEHNKNWRAYYESEKEELIKIIEQENITRINHIGSTAIPSLITKPTIDILIELNKNADIEKLISSMEKVGYIFSPQPEKPPPQMMFLKGYTPWGFKGQAFHIHIRYEGDWDEIYFRDYLISHPEAVKDYGKLKLQLQKKYKHNRDAYTEAKSDFIFEIIKKAKKL